VSRNTLNEIKSETESIDDSIYFLLGGDDYKTTGDFSFISTLKTFFMIFLSILIAILLALLYITFFLKKPDKILVPLILAQICRIILVFTDPLFGNCISDIYVVLYQVQEFLEVLSLFIYIFNSDIFADWKNLSKREYIYLIVISVFFALISLLYTILSVVLRFDIYAILPCRIMLLLVFFSILYYPIKKLYNRSTPIDTGQGFGIVILALHFIYAILRIIILFVSFKYHFFIALSIFILPIIISVLKVLGIYRNAEIIQDYISRTKNSNYHSISIQSRE